MDEAQGSDSTRHRLAGGHAATLRPAAESDAEALVALDRALVEDGRGVVLTEEDLPTPEERAASIAASSERSTILVAEVDGEVVAEATARVLGPALCRHVALLSLGVHPRRQRLGLGRALMQVALDWCAARTDPPVRRIELYCRSDNDRALALYESLGFEREAVRRRFVHLADGTFVDDVVMCRFLDV